MSAQPLFDDSRLARMEQATLWVQRMHGAEADERVVEAWLDWCQRDPLNQQAFDDIAAVWELGGQLAVEPRTASAVARRGVSRRQALAASVAVLGLATVAGAWWLNRPTPEQLLTSEFASPVGVNSVQKLADGSLLALGGGTRVTVAIGPRARRVELHEGEVFVTVHHDSSRPFTVDSGRLEVVATGTAFNVLRTSARTTITVAEGSVAAFHEGQAAEGPNVRLQTGQQLVYSHASHSVVVRQADPRHASAWRSGALYFENEPLSEVVATINRYTTQKIVIEEPRIAEFPFTGTAHVDRIGSWLGALPDIFSFPVAVVEQAGERRLVVPQRDARD